MPVDNFPGLSALCATLAHMVDIPTPVRSGADEPPVIPGYDVLVLLGFGAHGEVWLAKEQASGHDVALKIGQVAGQAGTGGMPGSGVGVPPDVGFSREAALLCRIRHPHVVQLHRIVALPDGRAAMVLEYAPGGNLGAVVAARGHLEPAEVTTLLVPLAGALRDLHGQGLAHGDLAPGNVLFAADGRPLLSDLGIARVLGTDRGDQWGTPGFVDPASELGADPQATDVWGLAAVAWFALTGAPPPGEGGLIRPVETLVVPALTALLAECLSPDPAVRPEPADVAARAWSAVRPAPIRLLPVRVVADVASAVRAGAAPAEAVTRRRPRAPDVDLKPTPGDAERATRAGIQRPGRRPRRAVLRRPAAAPTRDRIRRPLRTGRSPGWMRPVVLSVISILLAGGTAVAVLRAPGGPLGRSAARVGPPVAAPVGSPVTTQAMSGVAASEAAATGPGGRPGTPSLAEVTVALRKIGAARAAAFSTASVAQLATADAPGSPAMADDAALVARLAARGWRLDAVRFTVTDAHLVSASADRVQVSVRVTTSAHRRLRGDGVLVGVVPMDGPTAVTLALVRAVAPDSRSASGWRVYEVM